MKKKPLFAEIIESNKGLSEELKAIDVAADLAHLLYQEKISRAELSRKLGWSRSRTSQVLSGSGNLTIQTIAAISSALGYSLDIVFRKKQSTQDVSRCVKAHTHHSIKYTIPAWDIENIGLKTSSKTHLRLIECAEGRHTKDATRIKFANSSTQKRKELIRAA